jgi:beta-ribofuranosylaminobenzene 5'-phosphate synthase
LLVTIRVFPRIHVTLSDLGQATPRTFGGCGFILSGPSVEISVAPWHRLELRGFEKVDEAARRDVRAALRRFMKAASPGSSALVELRSAVPQHIGLGFKTGLILGCLSAASRALGAPLAHNELQQLSGRGGASGVGIHGFFLGGFILDAGHLNEDVPELLPSAGLRPQTTPALVSHIVVPQDWRFHLLLPAGRRISGRDEIEFFRRATPVSAAEVQSVIASVVHGVAAAVATDDLVLLREALTSIQRSGLKKREVAAQAPNVRKLLHDLENRGLPTGLSSLGPLVYAVARRNDALAKASIADAAKTTPFRSLGTWRARRGGAMFVSATSR